MLIEFPCPHCDADVLTDIPETAKGNDEIICEKCGWSAPLGEFFPDTYCVRCELLIDAGTGVEGYDIRGAICKECATLDDKETAELERLMETDRQVKRDEELLRMLAE